MYVLLSVHDCGDYYNITVVTVNAFVRTFSMYCIDAKFLGTYVLTCTHNYVRRCVGKPIRTHMEHAYVHVCTCNRKCVHGYVHNFQVLWRKY